MWRNIGALAQQSAGALAKTLVPSDSDSDNFDDFPADTNYLDDHDDDDDLDPLLQMPVGGLMDASLNNNDPLLQMPIMEMADDDFGFKFS